MPDGTFADRCLFYSERAVGDCSLMWRLHICRVPLWKRTVAFTFWRKYQLPKALLNSSNIVKQKLSTCIHFYLGRIFLADAEGSSDFFGNHDSSQIVYTTYYSCCFHIFTPFLYSIMCKNPSIYAGFWDLLVYSNYTSPEPILPLFSFVLAGHKGLEDLGRVVVFVLC